MPEKNRTYRARIEGYTSEGLGVARIDGQAVFVHRALRGEDCDVLILKVLKNAAFGKVVQVHEPSPHRREPDCPWYGRYSLLLIFVLMPPQVSQTALV